MQRCRCPYLGELVPARAQFDHAVSSAMKSHDIKVQPAVLISLHCACAVLHANPTEAGYARCEIRCTGFAESTRTRWVIVVHLRMLVAKFLAPLEWHRHTQLPQVFVSCKYVAVVVLIGIRQINVTVTHAPIRRDPAPLDTHIVRSRRPPVSGRPAAACQKNWGRDLLQK